MYRWKHSDSTMIKTTQGELLHRHHPAAEAAVVEPLRVRAFGPMEGVDEANAPSSDEETSYGEAPPPPPPPSFPRYFAAAPKARGKPTLTIG